MVPARHKEPSLQQASVYNAPLATEQSLFIFVSSMYVASAQPGIAWPNWPSLPKKKLHGYVYGIFRVAVIITPSMLGTVHVVAGADAISLKGK